MDYVMMFSTMHEVREGRARGYPAMILKNSKCNPSPDLSPQVFMRGRGKFSLCGELHFESR